MDVQSHFPVTINFEKHRLKIARIFSKNQNLVDKIMSEKRVEDFAKLIRHLDVQPSEFLMMGNSLKSDVLPVLELGGYAIHITFISFGPMSKWGMKSNTSGFSRWRISERQWS